MAEDQNKMSTEDQNKMSTVAIIFIVIGVICLIFILAYCYYWYKKGSPPSQ